MANLLSTDYRKDVHVIEEKTATALLVKQPDGSYRLGDESDITIGERCYLLLPNGGIVRTSPVYSWRKYGGFYITTKHTQYYISCDNIHVQ